jgi:hypothetical protein
LNQEEQDVERFRGEKNGGIGMRQRAPAGVQHKLPEAIEVSPWSRKIVARDHFRVFHPFSELSEGLHEVTA